MDLVGQGGPSLTSELQYDKLALQSFTGSALSDVYTPLWERGFSSKYLSVFLQTSFHLPSKMATSLLQIPSLRQELSKQLNREEKTEKTTQV